MVEILNFIKCTAQVSPYSPSTSTQPSFEGSTISLFTMRVKRATIFRFNFVAGNTD